MCCQNRFNYLNSIEAVKDISFTYNKLHVSNVFISVKRTSLHLYIKMFLENENEEHFWEKYILCFQKKREDFIIFILNTSKEQKVVKKTHSHTNPFIV